MLGEWADGAIYRSSAEPHGRPGGLADPHYQHRPHGALGHGPPAARLAELRNNAPGSYI
jgi:hypothetical protein